MMMPAVYGEERREGGGLKGTGGGGVFVIEDERGTKAEVEGFEKM